MTTFYAESDRMKRHAPASLMKPRAGVASARWLMEALNAG